MTGPDPANDSEGTRAVLTPDTLIYRAEELIDWDALREFYRSRGIMCLFCPAAEIETFAEGAKLHKFDLESHLAALNELASRNPYSGLPVPWWLLWFRRLTRKGKPNA